MAGVYCPTCEAGVEAAAKFCLSCGHDLTVQGPITATGHDLNQLKEVIRIRDDLSMAEKFDMIAKIEDGANPIVLGIAAPADGEDVDLSDAFSMDVTDVSASSIFSNHEWGQSPAANAAVRAVVRGTNGWDLIQAGKLDLKEGMFREAMDNGMEASQPNSRGVSRTNYSCLFKRGRFGSGPLCGKWHNKYSCTCAQPKINLCRVFSNECRERVE